MSRIKQSAAEGFTLVEILVIAPIVMVAISGFLALLISMVGDVLLTRDQNTMVYETQNALNRIEQDIKLSTQFLTTTGTLETPQGSNNNFTGNAAFTNTGGSTLILSAVATDQNPANAGRWLVYYANQPNACGSQQSFNRVFLIQVIYFIKDGSLWRRTVVPEFNTNASGQDAHTICPSTAEGIWQKNSCSPGYAANTRCQTNDERLLSNVGSFTINYYAKSGDATPVAASQAKDALEVKVTLTGQKTTAGQPVTSTGTLRATRLNNIDTSVPVPPSPTISYTLDGPASAKFSWNKIPLANTYEISYNINGGSWTNASLNADTLSYTVNANRNDTITFRVAAKNVAGTSDYATLSATMPAWTTFDLQNNWEDYGGAYETHAFTRSSAGVVMLKGLIKNGTATAETVIGTLPEGYRPAKRLIFYVSTYEAAAPNATASGMGRVDVLPNGEIRVYIGTTNWISLDNIFFLPATTPYNWTSLTYQNGWTNYSATTWALLRATKDSLNRAHLEGLAKPGTITSGVTIAGLPSGYAPARQALVAGKDTGSNFTYYGINSTNVISARGVGTSYMSVQAMYYPSTVSGWTNLTLQNGWVEHSTSFSSPQYIKGADGIVSLKGVIKSGSVTNASVIATLPVGYRPSKTLLMPVSHNGPEYGRVDILSNGNIIVRDANATWTSLDNLSFIADQ